ncbi:hypothetical protein E2C01_068803 [Portunus trituberculatus]|uniref:Uncharacterized protein n=1 Tax=Portunus trituberculatus TaxID=210409 RepID=A0A5B7I134_PORTR|nr:hypothetical protein [Portunus trituberculatus]
MSQSEKRVSVALRVLQLENRSRCQHLGSCWSASWQPMFYRAQCVQCVYEVVKVAAGALVWFVTDWSRMYSTYYHKPLTRGHNTCFWAASGSPHNVMYKCSTTSPHGEEAGALHWYLVQDMFVDLRYMAEQQQQHQQQHQQVLVYHCR